MNYIKYSFNITLLFVAFKTIKENNVETALNAVQAEVEVDANTGLSNYTIVFIIDDYVIVINTIVILVILLSHSYTCQLQ